MNPITVGFVNMTTTTSPPVLVSIILIICLSLIAIITAIGNVVVLAAFYCDKKLRTINDYFILNMAVADFLVGFFCIPFYIPFSVTQSWPFGRLFCKIWARSKVTVDDVTTMASVINIVAISVNRYWSIAYPISYRKYATQHLVYLVMAAVWCLSFVNFVPGIWLLSLFEETNVSNVTRKECSGDYTRSFIYMLIAQFNYFIWPFIVLCVLNILIMCNIWKRTRRLTRLTSSAVLSNPPAGAYLSSIPEASHVGEATENDQRLATLGVTSPIMSRRRRYPHYLTIPAAISSQRHPSVIVEENEQSENSFVCHSRPVTANSLAALRRRASSTLRSFFTRTRSSSPGCTVSGEYPSSPIDHYSISIPKTQNNFPVLQRSSCDQSILHPQQSNGIVAVKDRRSHPDIIVSTGRSNVQLSLLRSCRSDSVVEYSVQSPVKVVFRPNDVVVRSEPASPRRENQQRDIRIQRDKKAARSLFILVVVFLCFLLPYVIVATASTAGAHFSALIFEVAFWLLWLNSLCNPFLYPFIQMKYRRAYSKLFSSCRSNLSFSRRHAFL